MVGGLINVVSYVSSDLYLTGAPQITFYKMVYRRYTNFAMESVIQEFDNDIEFNQESELIPERVGDLIHKGYLRIKIPRFEVRKEDVGIDVSDFDFDYANESVITDFENVKNVYAAILTDIYRLIFKATNARNVNYTGLVLDVQNYVNEGNTLQLLAEYDELLNRTRVRLSEELGNPECILDYAILDPCRTNMWNILQKIDVTKLFNDAASNLDVQDIDPNSQEYTETVNQIMKNSVLKLMTLALEDLVKVQDLFFSEYKEFLKEIENDKATNIRFAWVRNLGFSIIDYLDVFIGGKRIDRHLGIWMNIWYELTHTEAQKRDFREMVGDVPELTNFDTIEKPEYTLLIPMSFWFNKYNGLSFPLLAMQYNTLRFRLKLRRLEEVSYVEKVYRVEINGTEKLMTATTLDYLINRAVDRGEQTITNIEEVRDVCIDDIFEDRGKRLEGNMLLDYVYLESKERKKFAQSGHEYLIERIQHDIFDDIDRTNFSVKLDFTNPSKEIVWVFHKDVYAQNPYAYTECRWQNHTIGDPHKNPVLDFTMAFNGYTRIQKQVGRYFDKLQPYIYHHTTPDDGINIYSFCIDPLQSQPTGSCNFSKLSDVLMVMNLDPRLLRYTIAELYPYYEGLDFILTLQDPVEFSDMIDIRSIRTEIRNLEDIVLVEGRNRTVHEQLRLEELQKFEEAYTELQSGENRIQRSIYRNVPLITTAKFYVFHLSINILRLIGGYGALAYSGND
jgi:Large eukaryotic DNA virus major capsid protein/Major capsid protein N-terminus